MKPRNDFVMFLLMVMTVVTAGLARVIKRNAAGHEVTGTESEGIGLDEWDNNEAPRPVFYSRFGGRIMASPDDSPIEHDVAYRGTEGDILCWQINPDAEFVADQADNALTRLQVLEIIYKADGSVKSSHRRTLGNADRITPAGGAGLTHRLGLADGGTLPAGVYSDYKRYAPPENAEWILIGRQRDDAHDNV